MEEIECRRCGRVIRLRRIEEAPFFPFCSKRCQMIDLGEWLSEGPRIKERLEDRPDLLADGEAAEE